MGGVGELRLVRRGAGPAAERVPGGYKLDAEHDWFVEGPDEALDAVRAVVSTTIAEAWGSVVRLRFGNSVGRVPAGPLGVLHVSSSKWSELEYEAMLADVASQSAALAFAAGAASSLPYARDPALAASDLPYHAFLLLRHVLLDAPRRPLLGALRAIVEDPHRRAIQRTREVPVELASTITPRMLDDVIAARWPFQKAASSDIGIRGLLPVRIAEPHGAESVDTAENRFVKSFLASCDHIVARVRERLVDAPAHTRDRLEVDARAIEGALAPIRRASLWRRVGPLVSMPTGSMVLQRRSAYREVLRASVLLRGGSRMLSLTDPEVVRLLEVKNIATLYEVWCGFQLFAVLRELLGEPSSIEPLSETAFNVNVKRGCHARWSTGAELAFNASYTQKQGWHGRSRSVLLRPDFALYTPSAGLHLFDAKFKLKWVSAAADDDDESDAKREDLHKMHAYRDAIPNARSAWVMYPGTTFDPYYDGGSGEVRGVGCFPARPGEVAGELRGYLARVLGQLEA